MNFPSYTFWHLSFKAVHNISPPVCHPSVELYQLPCSNLKQTDSILFLLSSSPTLLPPASHTVPDLQITWTASIFLPFQNLQWGAAPGQGVISSAGDHLSALLRSETPRSLWAPQQNTIPHTLTGPHIIVLSSQNRNGYVSSLSQKADAFSFMSNFLLSLLLFFFFLPTRVIFSECSTQVSWLSNHKCSSLH